MRLRRIPRGGDKRRHILQYDRARGDHSVGADAAELMYPDESSQHRMIADYDVAGELRIVRKRGVVTDDAIMRVMAIRQYPVSVTDRRRAAVERGPGVNGHELADDVVVADLGRRRFAAVFAVLRNLADRSELEDAIAAADARAAGNHDVARDRRPGAHFDFGADHRERTYADVRRKAGAGGDHRRGMDARHARATPGRRERPP